MLNKKSAKVGHESPDGVNISISERSPQSVVKIQSKQSDFSSNVLIEFLRDTLINAF